MSFLDALSYPIVPKNTMNLLIGGIVEKSFVFRVPRLNNLHIHMNILQNTYGGIFAMNMTEYIERFTSVPLFETGPVLLNLAKTKRIVILIPSGIIQTMYESYRILDRPLYSFDRNLFLTFIKASLYLEYAHNPDALQSVNREFSSEGI
jgi:hypothetical protein